MATKEGFEVGDFVDCMDSVQKWCVARIVGIKDNGKVLDVHFEGNFSLSFSCSFREMQDGVTNTTK